MSGHDDIETKLAELGARTANLKPRAGFEAKVLAAIRSEAKPVPRNDLLRPARFVLPFAAALAAISVIWAVQSDGLVDDAYADFDDVSVELEW
ncbi:MAG: hypothetical protein U0169_23315 [Polyangiaceae bacterium]